MQPLLRIQSIPITIEYQVTRAMLKHNPEPQPRPNVTRTKGRANIQTTPARVNIDSFEARASAGLKSAARLSSEFADQGIQASMEAARTYAENGNMVIDSHGKGDQVADIAASKVGVVHDTQLAFIPSVRPEITATPGSISFDYTMDKLTFDWNINSRPQLEFVPGNIEFSVTQYNDVQIEYIGRPIYVPPSADPEYEGPAVDETA